jgi:hypothetical protein
MSEEQEGGSFREYRKLIIAHMESSNRRQAALEDAIVDIRVQMGVVVVKVGLIVSLLLIVGGTISTYVVSAAVKTTAHEIAAERVKIDAENEAEEK